MEVGFEKADSDNLPRVDTEMVHDFYQQHMDFLSAETRNVKTRRATRESYGDNAIGYVQVKRHVISIDEDVDHSICTVRAKITPEHRVHGKYYNVEVVVNESTEDVISCKCESCAASAGGCKHAIAFLFWLHRRSEEPAVTEITCYWRSSALIHAGRKVKFMDLATLSGKILPPQIVKDEPFVAVVLDNVKGAEGGLFDLMKSPKNEYTSLYQMILKYEMETPNVSDRNPDTCIEFMSNIMNEDALEEAEKSTRAQSTCPLWYELRYGRITASRVHEASRCTTLKGALTETILGACKLLSTEAIERGRELEPRVIKKVAELRGIKIRKSGLILKRKFPVLGASPDGVSDDFVIEVKCPSKEKTVKYYVERNEIKPKYMAQIQLQMFFADKKKGLFCVAMPTFEESGEVKIFEVSLNLQLVENLVKSATEFWKKAIYPIFIH